ncbi:MAG: bleomycin resistance protein [Ktedonobacterales bacterium]
MTLKSLTPNLMVEDVDATIAFYRDTLGFTVTGTAPDASPYVWASLKGGDVEIMLQARHSLEDELPQLTGKPLGASLTFYIGVDDADALHSAIKDKAAIIKAPMTAPYGAREFYAQDPNGYILGFSSPLSSGEAAEGQANDGTGA